MRFLVVVCVSVISIFIIGVKAQTIEDRTESIDGKNNFNPHVITARMYDYSTDTIAYKDKPSKICYIQRMQKNIPAPLYISNSKSDQNEVELLAGKGIARFCQGLEVYKLLVPIK